MKLYLYQFGAYTESISIGPELARIGYCNHAINYFFVAGFFCRLNSTVNIG